jgi:general stress protein YciG
MENQVRGAAGGKSLVAKFGPEYFRELGKRGGRTGAGGRALSQKVDRSFFQFLGRRGGYAYMFNAYTRLAQTYDVRCSVEWGSFFECWTLAQIERWNEQRRAEFAECAERYRLENAGNKIMVGLWSDDDFPPKAKRRRAAGDMTKLRRWEQAVAKW